MLSLTKLKVVHAIKITLAVCLLGCTIFFGSNNAVDCTKMIAPECVDVDTSYIWGTSLNQTKIISRLSNDSVSLLRSICEIANTPEVHMIAEQIRLQPNKPPQNVIVHISYNYILFSIMVIFESLLLIIFIIECSCIIYDGQQYTNV